MRRFFGHFILRWAVSALGLWIAAAILGTDRLEFGNKLSSLLGAALLLALINMAVKPILVILSLPALIVSLGLFMLIINGATLVIASWLYEPLHVKNFGVAVVAGVILGIVNLLVSSILKDYKGKAA